ncbi:retrotransposon protein, putative, Ty3-gypsy sub-class [Cucumis melo var. makuwa]|uniref:Retrotransposon protein, putative, Ty3-gypsy sub-class n=1 Tax=Cucumis melo var. makuwa TaxID=1194695 RepID=A0A5D3DSJ4_CUCMM|nr:retrotransposon protein, putative, Ty3-gypsy sub-class [Cucumis melo var. makuwa]TYK26325.1 retrotransposon protein, putative, Ty3-gypsy sub-class [Cucumis melo var. makuwa]
MQDFDVILRMDWLSANDASIECSRKEVVFNPPSAASFKYKKIWTVVLPKVISTMKASKLLNQGTSSILASVVDIEEPKVSLSSKPVPDTTPISRAPYRMASIELKELKVQLLELTRVSFDLLYDILVYSKAEAKHEEDLHQYLVREFLLIQQIKVVTCWPRPSKVSEVRSFLGLADKMNVVADALSRKVSHSVALITEHASLLIDLERAEIVVSVGEVTSQLRRQAEAGQDEEFSISFDGGLMFESRLCIPADSAVKAPRQRPTGLLQPLSVPKWKWENMFMDFITGLPRTLNGDTVIYVVVDRLTKSAHFIPGKSTYTATIRLPLAWHHLKLCMVGVVDLLYVEKSYAGERRKDLKFDVGDMVFLKVAHMKGVLRFEKKGKLSPRFVGSFEILAQIGPVAYRLALPPSFSIVHDAFHVSMLRKEVKMLDNRGIALLKVLWQNHGVEEATWKREDDMRAQYPELFED